MSEAARFVFAPALGIALLLAALTPGAQPAPALRRAVERAIVPLQRSAGAFVAQRGCVSCHHNILAVQTLRMAMRRGIAVDRTVLDAVESKTFRELRSPTALDDAVQGANVSDPTPNDSGLLMAAEASGLPRDIVTAVYARRIARWQRDGHWTTSDFRPPHSSSSLTATATAVRALKAYMPEERAGERDAAIARARQWLMSTKPQSTEDAAFRLLGLVWSGASTAERSVAQRALLARQLPDGGWPQLPGYDPDAYSTGEALFAMRENGTASADPQWARGASFLMSTQASDGTWRVKSRMLSPASISPEYFSTGFPYAKDEYLSYAGTTWATMALLSSLPPAATTDAAPQQPVTTTPAPGWARAALFGSAADLRSRLDAGLDPDSATNAGTSVLMMAASDEDKVALLLLRGARADRRATSGADAVGVAATYRETSASLQRLLQSGGAAQPPETMRVRHAPLAWAAMTGDVTSVRLLLSKGAPASADALSEAVTFGHAGIVSLLIGAGADVRLVESSGVNLLHWAIITNRPTVIPVLAKAGVPLNAVDDKGFTPLMYAATVDVGDTATLRALLAAGADRRIRNHDGRTPLEQARHYGHTAIAAALR